ncbi:MSMEG_1061 family FMN-dependent PPOX-type flavoprotein [Arenibaculum sp.]|jgi:hypothetical protein|uniref:MSMEG_1061 family FMN-dependent PPOX-type flavoprotein n=1 Tax=Arenibaculum sp. TaxID=2865862 RepID=UPI002E0DA3E7|nr:MSMEG_1061 family FMN-dependent PPOX-type flavoprotein [Arenibaculum sp.]
MDWTEIAALPTAALSRVTDAQDLRARFEGPGDHVVRRQLDRLDAHGRRFVELSPFLLLASGDPSRGLDVSPRGDAPGFVRVLDDTRLVLPDRPGNNRLDTFHNILAWPSVALLFLVPGLRECFRVNGEATVCDEPALRAACSAQGREPKLVVVVDVKEAFFHCGKAAIRSRLWEDDHRAERGAFPSLAEITADQIRGRERLDEIAAKVDANYKLNFY